MLLRNPAFDLTRMEIYDFSDLVDILGSESLIQARRIVGISGIAWKQPMNADMALKQAQDDHSPMPAFWAEDGSGYRGSYYVPVLKEKPVETLKPDDVQLIVELLIRTMGAEGYRSVLSEMENKKEVWSEYAAQTGCDSSWENSQELGRQAGMPP